VFLLVFLFLKIKTDFFDSKKTFFGFPKKNKKKTFFGFPKKNKKKLIPKHNIHHK